MSSRMRDVETNNKTQYLGILASHVENITDYFISKDYDNVTEDELQFINNTLPNLFTESVYNFTTDDPSLNLTKVVGAKTQLLLYDYLIPTIGALIIILNAIVVISSGLILRSGANPRTTYLFLGNVAMADLVTGVAVIFGQLYPKESRDQTTCAIQLGMIVSSTLASVWSVGLIAIDRFLYIIQGLKYQRLIYPRRARLLILGTWIIGLIIGFLPAMGWSGITDGGRVCWFIRLAPPGLVVLTTCMGLLPIILVLVLYSVILYHAILKVNQLKRADLEFESQNTGHTGHTNQNKNTNGPQLRIFRGGNSTHTNNQTLQKKSSPKKVKAIKVVIFTSGSFILTWLPYFIACSIYVFITDDELRKPLRLAIASPLAILGFFNSLLNPVIYAWWHNGFRTFMYKLVCRKRSQNQVSASNKQNSKSYRKRRNFSSSSNSATTSTKISNTSENTTDTSENTKL